MNTIRNRFAIVLLGCLPLVAACNREKAPPAPANEEATTALGGVVKRATDKARVKLETQNISISDGVHIEVNGHSIRQPGGKTKAEITPQGDLLIEGKAQDITPAQRALLLQYRQQIIQVAGAGMDIGVQGADLGMKAASEAISGIFSGNTDQVEKRVKAQAQKIEASARELCKLLPPMMSTQQELATSLPAFKPYATMEQSDIDDCMDHHGSADDATRAQIREEIRHDIRSAVRDSVQAVRGDDPSADASRDDTQDSAKQ